MKNTQSPGSVKLRAAQKHHEQYIANRAHNLPAWIRAADPDHAPNLEHVPTPLLQDLYPHLWAYGPHGNHYIAQLAVIKTTLDRLLSKPEDETFLKVFLPLGHYKSAIESIQHYSLNDYTRREGMPLPGADLLDNWTVPDDGPGIPLINHVVWDEYPENAYTQFINALECFAFTTVYLHFLQTAATDAEALLNTYTSVCRQLGIPT